MSYTVIFTPEAEEQVTELYRYIAGDSSPEIAARYTDSLIAFCESFETFPHRGSKREDILPGLRTVGYRRRVLIAFSVEEDEVVIIGIFYGGQDYEGPLTEGPPG
jgi:toxin ParE1/3/4